MTVRNLIILSLLTVVVVIAAMVVIMESSFDVTPARDAPAPLFDDLESRINEIGTVQLVMSDHRVTLKRDGTAWRVEELDGYPAVRTRVTGLIFDLAEARKIEAKTANEDLYGRLGVRRVGHPDSQAVRIDLQDAGGATLASVLVGFGRDAGGTERWTYVRKPGEAQSWMVAGLPDIKTDAVDWVDPQLLSVDRERVRHLTINHPDGETVLLARAAPDEEGFMLAEVPPGRVPRGQSALNTVAGALGYVTFDHVRAAEGLDFSAAVTTRVETFDGLTVTLETTGESGDQWTRLSAAWSADDVMEAGDEAVVLPGAPEDGAAEAEAINEKTGGWAYRLPPYKREDLTARLADLTEAEDGGQPGGD